MKHLIMTGKGYVKRRWRSDVSKSWRAYQYDKSPGLLVVHHQKSRRSHGDPGVNCFLVSFSSDKAPGVDNPLLVENIQALRSFLKIEKLLCEYFGVKRVIDPDRARRLVINTPVGGKSAVPSIDNIKVAHDWLLDHDSLEEAAYVSAFYLE